MERFLFTDGSDSIKEVHSITELHALAANALQRDKVKIWTYHTSQWISYDAFWNKHQTVLKADQEIKSATRHLQRRASSGKQWLKKFLFISITLASALVIFNFTKISWENAGTFYSVAVQPANVPSMDIDSLLTAIEDQRGQKLDRSTRTNLAARNTWPSKISLQLDAIRENSSNKGTRFSGTSVTIQNNTGFELDNAVVRVNTWKNSEVQETDTLQFDKMVFAVPCTRELKGFFYGDSLSVSFESIKAKSFNFFYSDRKRGGNENDRWFWRENAK